MVKVSVIVPIYNGEQHLRQCLDSICNQTLKEIEIICVDDGSTDASIEILKEYQQQDERIKIIHQQNLYAGVARNNGKAQATGEYLVFWDCDDFFELNALELMYEKASQLQVDICVCGANQYLEEYDKKISYAGYLNKKRIPEAEVFNRETNEQYILNFTNEAAWNKMFSRKFVEEKGLDFQSVRNGNDVYFTACALCLAEKITVVEDALVNYRKNQGESLVGSLTKSPMTPFQAWIDVAETLIERNAFPEQSYENKVVASSVYLLRKLKTRDALFETLDCLRDGGFEKLHIQRREPEYFINPWHAEYVNHLLADSNEDFQMFMFNSLYEQLVETGAKKRISDQKVRERNKKISNLKEKNEIFKLENKALKLENKVSKQKYQSLLKKMDALKNKVEKLECSLEYRIGKMVLWMPKKLKKLIKR